MTFNRRAREARAFFFALFLFVLACVFYACTASAATFQLFSPATGIQKGTSTSYVMSSATNADIYALFSCGGDSTKFLRGDGSCTVPTGTGVTSVAMTVPSVFSVSGSPITSSGTLAVTFSSGQTQNQVLASPNGSSGAISLRALTNADLANSAITLNGTSVSLGGSRTLALASSDFANNGTTTTVLHGNAAGNPSFAAVSLTADVSGTLPAGNGGTGVTSLGTLSKTDDTNVTLTLGGTPTGALINSTSLTLGWTGTLAASRGGLGMSTVTDDTIAIANGTTWQSKALPSCTDTGGNHLNYDISTNALSCGTSGATTFANPSGLIGMTAVNGVATTALRSDGRHAIDPAIAPTWTGTHTFTPASGGAITVNGVNSAYLARFIGGSGTGTSLGPLILAGTNASDAALTVNNQANSLNYFIVAGDGQTQHIDGSASTPAISFLSDKDTGFYSSAANAITATTGGTARFSVSNTGLSVFGSSNNLGFTGAGTSHVYTRWTNTGGDGYIGLDSSAGGNLFSGNAAYSMNVGTSGATQLALGTNSVVRMKIDSAGTATFNAATSARTLNVVGAANQYAMAVSANGTIGQSYGALIDGGTNSSDVALNVRNQAGTLQNFTVTGIGAIAVNNGDYGTSGQVLTSQGSTTTAKWASPSATIIAGGSIATNGSGGCSLTSNATVGLTSCSASSTVVTVTFTATAAHFWVCTASNESSSNAYIVNTGRVGTTTATIRSFNLTSTGPITWSTVDPSTTAITYQVTCQPV